MQRKYVKRIAVAILFVVLIVGIKLGVCIWSWYKGVGEDIKKREQYYDSLRASGVNPDSPMVFTEEGQLIQADTKELQRIKQQPKDTIAEY